MLRNMNRILNAKKRPVKRHTRPTLETLEGRMLLYATTGGSWTEPARITYSIVPDGTSIGGVPSNLQATLNAKFPTATWQQQIDKAAAAWAQVAHIQVVRVPDDGSPIGTSGDQQGDGRFGDIRIGGFAQSSGQLAFAYAPPPFNGGTTAGDIFFNTSQSWQVNGSTYDLATVALHEFGHALGLAHSSVTSSDMYATYTATKQSLTSDDTSGIRAIYGANPSHTTSNTTASGAQEITSQINTAGQITMPGLALTMPSGFGTDVDWYKVTVPASTTRTMVVQMQSSGLSDLAPSLAVYNATGQTLLGQQSSTNYGSTVSVTLCGVTAGQVYLIKATGASTGPSGDGAYGMLVNFGSSPQSAIAPPNTTVAAKPSQGGGTSTEKSGGTLLSINLLGIQIDIGLHLITVGTLSGWGDTLDTGRGAHGHPHGPAAHPGHAAARRFGRRPAHSAAVAASWPGIGGVVS
jgi:hypothetical protein